VFKNSMENMLMHYIPEVIGVLSLEEEEEGEGGYEGGEGGDDVVVEQNSNSEGKKKMKTYQNPQEGMVRCNRHRTKAGLTPDTGAVCTDRFKTGYVS